MKSTIGIILLAVCSVLASCADYAEILKGKTISILAAGQSNAASCGQKKFKAQNITVTACAGGRAQAAEDPMPGTSGGMGSIWPLLGDMLVDTGACDAVSLFTVAEGSTSVKQWAPGGDMHSRLIHAIEDGKRLGVPITHFVWHQGETDSVNRMSRAEYRQLFCEMVAALRSAGLTGPIIVCRATHNPPWPDSPDILAAQNDIIEEGAIAGPNTDLYGPGLRWDGVHFNEAGQRRFASELLPLFR